MITFSLPEYCDNHHDAIRIMGECSKALSDHSMALYDYGAESEELSNDYVAIESTSLLELRYNRIANDYIFISKEYDNLCEIRYTKKGNAYIKTMGAKYRMDEFIVSTGKFDGVYTISNTSALGIVLLDNGDNVYTKIIG